MADTARDGLPGALRDLDLFAAADRAELEALASTLDPLRVSSGDDVMCQGEPGRWFALIVDGAAVITRHDRDDSRTVGAAGPGSILGEIALLRGVPRSATVTATQPITALAGDAAAFARLLELPGVKDRLVHAAVQRLAAHARPVDVALADGSPLQLRPALPSDREMIVTGLERFSPESRRRRFFTAGSLTDRVIDYLVDIDYLDHFAWVALAGQSVEAAVASARYIRTPEDHAMAEIALDVIDDYQGRGLGRLLLGALAAAAPAADIVRFKALVLADNRPMRGLLDKLGARWTREEPGVIATAVDVAAARALIDPGVAQALEDAAHGVITAADVPLA